VRITGNLQLAEVDRRFFQPSSGREWSVDYTGELDLTKQSVLLETTPLPEEPPSLHVRLRIDDYLQRPDWMMEVSADRLPIETTPVLARELGFQFPASVEVAGEATGVFSWERDGNPSGHIVLYEGTLAADGSSRIHSAETGIELEDGWLRAGPAKITIGEEGSAELTASIRTRTGERDIRVRTDGVSLPVLRNAWKDLAGLSPPEAIALWGGGSVTGVVRFRQDAKGEGRWSADWSVGSARFVPPELGVPVVLEEALLVADGPKYSIRSFRGSASGVEFTGSYEHTPGGPRAGVLTLRFEELPLAEIEPLLGNLLDRPRPGLLARTLRRRAAGVPEWLRERRLELVLEAKRATADRVALEGLAAHGYWDGTRIEFPRIEASIDGAGLIARLTIDLADSSPAYELAASVSEIEWPGGRLTAEGRVHASGVGPGLLESARGEGSFTIRPQRSGAVGAWNRASGCYEFSSEPPAPRLLLPCIEIQRGGQVYYGWGGVDAEGGIRLELFNEAGSYEAGGRISPLELVLKESGESTLE
jgi:hypothetical protein